MILPNVSSKFCESGKQLTLIGFNVPLPKCNANYNQLFSARNYYYGTITKKIHFEMSILVHHGVVTIFDTSNKCNK